MNGLVLITTLVLVAAGVLYAINNNTSPKEGFWMTPSRSVKVEKVFQDCNKPGFYQVPNFQSTLSPRFSNVDYGANLQGRLPQYSMLGVPYDPLMNTAKSLNTTTVQNNTQNCLAPQYEKVNENIEPYCSGWQSTNIVGAPGVPLDPHNSSSAAYNNGNYNEVLSLAVDSGASSWPATTIAEPNRASLINEDGQLSQPIIYDRYIFANKNSRQRGAGDPIRGDLPIVPVSGSWFIPSQANNPSLNLQQGAMNVMGGVNNETSNALANLIWNSTGGAETTIGGVNMADTVMTHQVYGAASAAQNDVVVKTFP